MLTVSLSQWAFYSFFLHGQFCLIGMLKYLLWGTSYHSSRIGEKMRPIGMTEWCIFPILCPVEKFPIALHFALKRQFSKLIQELIRSFKESENWIFKKAVIKTNTSSVLHLKVYNFPYFPKMWTISPNYRTPGPCPKKWCSPASGY